MLTTITSNSSPIMWSSTSRPDRRYFDISDYINRENLGNSAETTYTDELLFPNYYYDGTNWFLKEFREIQSMKSIMQSKHNGKRFKVDRNKIRRRSLKYNTKAIDLFLDEISTV